MINVSLKLELILLHLFSHFCFLRGRCAVRATAAAGAARTPRTAVHAGPGCCGQAAGGRCGRRVTATRGIWFCSLEEFQCIESSLIAGQFIWCRTSCGGSIRAVEVFVQYFGPLNGGLHGARNTLRESVFSILYGLAAIWCSVPFSNKTARSGKVSYLIRSHFV